MPEKEETKEDSLKNKHRRLYNIGEGVMVVVALGLTLLFSYLIIFRTEEFLSAPIFPKTFSKIPEFLFIDLIIVACVVMAVFSLFLQNGVFTSTFSCGVLGFYLLKHKEDTISSLVKLKDAVLNIRFSFQSLVIILLLIIIVLLILIIFRRRE